MELVKLVNGEIKASSRTIAHVFEKKHYNILRDIRNLEMSNDFRKLNFEEGTYVDSNGDEQPKFLMTRDGWSFLAMGFTGKKAAKFKEDFITAFNMMEKELTNKLPTTYKEALQELLIKVEENEKLESELKEAQPKIEFHDKVEKSVNSITIAEFANILSKDGFDIGQNRLFDFMYQHKYLIKSNRPYQHTLENKWLEVDKKTYEDLEGKERTSHQVVVTGKGQTYFAKKISEHFDRNPMQITF